MSYPRLLTVMWTLALILAASLALAEVPKTINYQGRLTDNLGQPLDTTVSMTFTIYDDSTGGTVLWTETHPTVTITNGLFNVILGATLPIDDSIFAGSDRWLGITVGIAPRGEPEIRPRTKLASVPYASHVGTIDSASGGTINGDLKVTGHLEVGTQTLVLMPPDEILATTGQLVIGKAVSGSFDPDIKVGIGTTTPGAKLDVENGTALFTLGGGAQFLSESAVAIGTAYNDRHGLSIRTSNNASPPGLSHASLWIENVGQAGYTLFAGDELNDPTPFVITHEGNVGIGTTEPQAMLEVNDAGADYASFSDPVGYFGTDMVDKIALVGDASPGAGLFLPPGKTIGVYGSAMGGTENWGGYFIGNVYVSGDVGIGISYPQARLHVCQPSLTDYYAAIIENRGEYGQGLLIRGGAGTEAPGEYALLEVERYSGSGLRPLFRVNGKSGITYAREIEVSMSYWPDHVFEENYPLMSLQEVERFIKTYGSLPDLPSEEDVVSKGINLGEMDAKLLQKIEELTLYLIDFKEENERLEARIASLENSIAKGGK